MWCIGALTQEYRPRMYALLERYARPLSRAEPVVCIDKKSLQLTDHSRAPLPMASHSPAKVDYEYVRKGTRKLFVAVEPKAGKRFVWVTAHRCKADFVAFIDQLLTHTYAQGAPPVGNSCKAAPNAQQRTIEWQFTRQDADQNPSLYYVSKLSC